MNLALDPVATESKGRAARRSTRNVRLKYRRKIALQPKPKHDGRSGVHLIHRNKLTVCTDDNQLSYAEGQTRRHRPESEGLPHLRSTTTEFQWSRNVVLRLMTKSNQNTTSTTMSTPPATCVLSNAISRGTDITLYKTREMIIQSQAILIEEFGSRANQAPGANTCRAHCAEKATNVYPFPLVRG